MRGLYRFVRNPMYLSVTIIVLGETLLTHSTALFVYWTIWFACVNLFVIGYEEPALRRQFGAEYDRYAQAVGRWLPRWPPVRGCVETRCSVDPREEFITHATWHGSLERAEAMLAAHPELVNRDIHIAASRRRVARGPRRRG